MQSQKPVPTLYLKQGKVSQLTKTRHTVTVIHEVLLLLATSEFS